MRLLLINPQNLAGTFAKPTAAHWTRYRVWKPLGLMVVAGATPREWDITIVDENLEIPDYAAMPRPDLVGLTAFTSQAPRAYALATDFRARVTTGLCPAINSRSRNADSTRALFSVAFPTPMFTTTFTTPGICITLA